MMATKLTKEQFDRAIDGMVNLKYDGTWSYKVGQHNGRDVAIVLGWTDDLAEGGAKYQIKLFGKTWTLCGKIAYSVGNTKTDFEYDWAIPVLKDGDVYDSNYAIDDKSFDYLKDEYSFPISKQKCYSKRLKRPWWRFLVKDEYVIVSANKTQYKRFQCVI